MNASDCIECAYRFNGCDGYLPLVDCNEGHKLFKTFGQEEQEATNDSQEGKNE
jgi:hypothetical protein